MNCWIIYLLFGFINLEDGIAELQIFPQIFIQSLDYFCASFSVLKLWKLYQNYQNLHHFKNNVMGIFRSCTGFSRNAGYETEIEMATFLETALFYPRG